ncbi:hypothetical protein TrLO_g2924 [Triparma laevis f. longispina]|uniref:valine--tRNA ligase n=1 Tax=Triparma laevis f. longispina TaxID=1714387 RepID=A0A9W7FHQ4_9STRA|nr:hypothetical protein TrLO_g2924 [Triparma laevis f. longispina]
MVLAVLMKGSAGLVGRNSLINARKRVGFVRSSFARSSSLLSSTSATSPTTSSLKLPNSEQPLENSYDPSTFEGSIYSWWESNNMFDPDAKPTPAAFSSSPLKPYVIPMPPPNVTGRLHMGHAIFVALQDVLARFHRMRGRPTLWTPGTDHAGIATQLQVEKRLIEEGKTREEVGREEFLKLAWEYKEEQGGAITKQLRSLGASADWSRERFTMDPQMTEGVIEAFVRLHEKGLVYRGEYMVNWAPQLKTAVSDLEVDYSEEMGKLYYFKYVLEDNSDEFLPVATTRPETIWGDTAVCVHPEDDRFKHLVGKRVKVIEPMVSSQWFVKTKGMGEKALNAVKNKDIQIIPSRFEKVWYNWLEDIHDWCISRQLWWGHRIPVYYIDGAEDNFVVARSMEEAKVMAAEKGFPDASLEQENDVLDTWFSSGLWPFATVGWPQQENAGEQSDLARFYSQPTDACLETGYDILFFWVARMVMMGMELTDKIPFNVVYMHGLVRAADNTKMSKTKGNVVDPLETVDKYGADSLRYSLVTGVTPGQDIPLNMDKIEANRMFGNKLWNIAKFVVDNALKEDKGEAYDSTYGVTGPMSAEEFSKLAVPEKWIVTKCHKLIESCTSDIENYQLGQAGSKVYEFLRDDLADWYLEMSKTRFYPGLGGNDPEVAMASKKILVYCFDRALRVLHPYMPFVTETLWHKLPRAPPPESVPHSISLADWPMLEGEELVKEEEALKQFEVFQSLVRSIRNARAEFNVEQGKKIPAVIVVRDDMVKVVADEVASIVLLARMEKGGVVVCGVGSEEALAAAGEEGNVQLVAEGGTEIYIPKAGMVDAEKEKARLTKQQEKLGKEIVKLSGRLDSPGFAGKAPEAVVEKARQELADLVAQAEKVKESLMTL